MFMATPRAGGASARRSLSGQPHPSPKSSPSLTDPAAPPRILEVGFIPGAVRIMSACPCASVSISGLRG
jgi:hypothetical protein